MGFLATKHDLALAFAADWTQVDLQGKVTGTPTQVTLEVKMSGNRKLSLRSATGGITLEHQNAAEASKLTTTQQAHVPLASNRYFEYKLDAEPGTFEVYLIAQA